MDETKLRNIERGPEEEDEPEIVSRFYLIRHPKTTGAQDIMSPPEYGNYREKLEAESDMNEEELYEYIRENDDFGESGEIPSDIKGAVVARLLGKYGPNADRGAITEGQDVEYVHDSRYDGSLEQEFDIDIEESDLDVGELYNYVKEQEEIGKKGEVPTAIAAAIIESSDAETNSDIIDAYYSEDSELRDVYSIEDIEEMITEDNPPSGRLAARLAALELYDRIKELQDKEDLQKINLLTSEIKRAKHEALIADKTLKQAFANDENAPELINPEPKQNSTLSEVSWMEGGRDEVADLSEASNEEGEHIVSQWFAPEDEGGNKKEAKKRIREKAKNVLDYLEDLQEGASEDKLDMAFTHRITIATFLWVTETLNDDDNNIDTKEDFKEKLDIEEQDEEKDILEQEWDTLREYTGKASYTSINELKLTQGGDWIWEEKDINQTPHIGDEDIGTYDFQPESNEEN